MYGLIKWFGGYNSKLDTMNDYGFLETSAGDVYFHKKSITNYEKVKQLLQEGQLVQVELKASKVKLTAESVTLIKNFKKWTKTQLESLLSSGLRLSLVTKNKVNEALREYANSLDDITPQIESWLSTQTRKRSIFSFQLQSHSLYSVVQCNEPNFENSCETKLSFEPRATFEHPKVCYLLEQANFNEADEFINKYGMYLSAEDLNNILAYMASQVDPNLFEDEATIKVNDLHKKYFRRLDRSQLQWLADSYYPRMNKWCQFKDASEMFEILELLRTMSPLYHMTHINNIPMILKHGLCSHQKAHQKRLVKKDISMKQAQSYRKGLHHLVPTYFNPRNTMLYYHKENQANIVMIAINPFYLLGAAMISNRNAAARDVLLYENKSGTNFMKILKQLDWTAVMGSTWNYSNPETKYYHKQVMCAEALFDDKVPVSHFEYIATKDRRTLDTLKTYCKAHSVMALQTGSLYFE